MPQGNGSAAQCNAGAVLLAAVCGRSFKDFIFLICTCTVQPSLNRRLRKLSTELSAMSTVGVRANNEQVGIQRGGNRSSGNYNSGKLMVLRD